MAHRAAGARCLGQGWRGRFADLSGGKLRTERSGCASGAGWPALATASTATTMDNRHEPRARRCHSNVRPWSRMSTARLVTDDKISDPARPGGGGGTARKRNHFFHHQRPAAARLAHAARPLGITTPVIGFNGGVIATPDLSVITEHLLSPEIARRAVDMLDARRRAGMGFQRAGLAGARPRRALCRARGAHRRVPADGRRGFRTPPSMPPPRSSASARISSFSHGASAMCEPRSPIERPSPVRSPTTSTSPIRSPTKARALSEIAKLLGVPLAEIAVIGDGGNDVAMFERSGLSIAMGNASPEVQQAADFVTDSNERRRLRQCDRAVHPRRRSFERAS